MAFFCFRFLCSVCNGLNVWCNLFLFISVIYYTFIWWCNILPYYGWEIAIYEDKESEKIVKFASSGNGMSDKWWKETKRLNDEGLLYGVYQVASGLRRAII